MDCARCWSLAARRAERFDHVVQEVAERGAEQCDERDPGAADDDEPADEAEVVAAAAQDVVDGVDHWVMLLHLASQVFEFLGEVHGRVFV
jgi:hypothetical protein